MIARIAFLLLTVAFLAWLLTGLLRRYALHAKMVDVPNERSSHDVPTPRGGGAAPAVVIFAIMPILHHLDLIGRPTLMAMLLGGPMVLLIGWLDDRRGLPAAWRGVAYLLAAVTAISILGGVPAIDLGMGQLRLGLPGQAAAVLALTWLINLYNFMDGTDALAGVQAVSVAIYAALLFIIGGDAGAAWICAAIAAASTGFLLWNWPPAAIFMGDSGSCVLGFVFGVLAVLGEQETSVPILAWMILLSIFLCDSTLTLIRRVIAGEKWYSPHRSHAYQLLVQAGLSHRGLALGVLAVNLLVLGPLAVLAVLNRALLLPVTAAVMAVMCLAWAAIQLRMHPARHRSELE